MRPRSVCRSGAGQKGDQHESGGLSKASLKRKCRIPGDERANPETGHDGDRSEASNPLCGHGLCA
eukprot:15187107-Alexandrium_andersonii.AAC.1